MDTPDATGGDRWREVDALFARILQVPPEHRADALAETTRGDPELRRAVQELLDALVGSDRVLDGARQSMKGVARDMTGIHGHDEGLPSGHRVGPWRIEDRVSRGGMGTVYTAERADGRFRQRVAVKILRRGLDTEDVLARFRAERQILASLDHPNIARLIDGGSTDDGRPYLVTELVSGRPILDHATAGALDVDARLRLFCDVGRAVQHAHSRMVVHRDLKPSNILVDGAGRVKLLDFGIAKLLDPAAWDEVATPRTRTGTALLTPRYASPEQRAGKAVGAASDIYQLGLLLCELLTGHAPLPAEGVGIHVERRPSVLLGRLGPDERDREARRRSTTPRKLLTRLRGDLDTIAATALHPDPDRRYGSVEALVADVERYLMHLPVTARPDSRGYRLRKFVQRHAWVPAVAAALICVLVGYGVLTVRHARALAAERDVARLEAERAAAVTDFTVGLFQAADPLAPRPDSLPGSEAPIREILDAGARRLRTDLADQPLLRARMLGVLADAHEGLNEGARAQELRREALAIELEEAGPRSPEVASSLLALSRYTWQQGDFRAADSLARASLALAETLWGPDSPQAGERWTILGLNHRSAGRREEAVAALRRADEILRGQPGGLDVSGPSMLLAQELAGSDPETALDLARRALEHRVRELGPEHPRTADAWVVLGGALDGSGSPGEGLAAKRRAIEIYDARLGVGDPRTLRARNNLAVSLAGLGRYREAEVVLREVLGRHLESSDSISEGAADVMQNIATSLRDQERLREAVAMSRQAHGIYAQVLGTGHYKTGLPLLTLSELHLELRQWDAAVGAATDAHASLSRTLPEGHWIVAVAEGRLGRALAGTGAMDRAEAHLSASHAALATGPPAAASYEREMATALAELYRMQGREDAARALLREGAANSG